MSTIGVLSLLLFVFPQWNSALELSDVSLIPFKNNMPKQFPPLSGYYNASDPPDSFDARTQFPSCKYLFDSMGQGSYACGDCAAQSVAAFKGIAMCRFNDKRISGTLSAYYVLTCVDMMSNSTCTGISQNGIITASKEGYVSGANQVGRKLGCLSYGLPLCKPPNFEPSCPNKKNESIKFSLSRANCPKTCDDGSDFHPIGREYYLYQMDTRTVKAMEQAIQEIGCIVASYWIGAKFKAYDGSEIFSETEDDYKPRTSNHFFLLLGWGSTMVNGSKVDFWIGKNSWGANWGMNGYFKIKKGVNLNDIEYAPLQGHYAHAECNPTVFTTLRREFLVDGRKMACYSLSRGRTCKDGCIPYAYSSLDLDFACFELHSKEDRIYRKRVIIGTVEDEYLGIVRKMKVPFSCLPQ